MSKHDSDQPRDGAGKLTRRRFVQSTALLTGLSISGKQVAEASPVEAREHVAEVKIADAVPPAPRAPTATVQIALQDLGAPPIALEEFIKLSKVLTGFDKLESDLAAQYLQRCTDNPE